MMACLPSGYIYRLIWNMRLRSRLRRVLPSRPQKHGQSGGFAFCRETPCNHPRPSVPTPTTVFSSSHLSAAYNTCHCPCFLGNPIGRSLRRNVEASHRGSASERCSGPAHYQAFVFLYPFFLPVLGTFQKVPKPVFLFLFCFLGFVFTSCYLFGFYLFTFFL